MNISIAEVRRAKHLRRSDLADRLAKVKRERSIDSMRIRNATRDALNTARN
jgi:hypothetical protein